MFFTTACQRCHQRGEKYIRSSSLTRHVNMPNMSSTKAKAKAKYDAIINDPNRYDSSREKNP
jgi:hypothetical protein